MDDPELIDRIRAIFLHPRPRVSISAAAALLGWSSHQMKAAISAGEIELRPTRDGKWVTLEELMAKALETWPREVIEEALGAEAETVLPEAERLVELHARIPQYQLATLAHLASAQHTTISDVLTRELDDLASAYVEALAHAIPGLRDALG